MTKPYYIYHDFFANNINEMILEFQGIDQSPIPLNVCHLISNANIIYKYIWFNIEEMINFSTGFKSEDVDGRLFGTQTLTNSENWTFGDNAHGG